MKKVEHTALDPLNPTTQQKTQKLIEFLSKERTRVLNELAKMCSDAGESIIHILQQVGWAQENGRNPLWGSYGPAQGLRIEQISSFAGRLYQIDETLEAIYELWPKLKPATPVEPQIKRKPRKKA